LYWFAWSFFVSVLLSFQGGYVLFKNVDQSNAVVLFKNTVDFDAYLEQLAHSETPPIKLYDLGHVLSFIEIGGVRADKALK
jgi:hypothetical protein